MMKNSEILYLYDAKITNPNGDPDEENRPRMDYERDINLVSDLRIKRYIRDYLMDRNYSLFVQKIDNKSVTAKQRIEKLKKQDVKLILNELIDVRMFGATIPIKSNTMTFIGPIQFNWGYSLNKVELLESSITSHFASDEKYKQGAIGKDYRVKYSFIAFSGVISGKRAEHTQLSYEDVELFDSAMRHAITEQVTRSKIGQYPRLYMRIQYKDNETILGDMRSKISLNAENESIRHINECSLEIGKLVEFLNEYSNRIEKIFYYYDDALKLTVDGKQDKFKNIFSFIDIEEVE